MSHRTQLATEIKSIEAAIAAANALGIRVLNTKKVRNYYSTGDNGTNWSAVDVVLSGATDKDIKSNGENWASEQYNVGLKQQPDGTYAFVYDAWGIKDAWAGEDKAWCRRFGPTFGNWKSGDQDGMGGHVGTGKPTRFLQEYGLQLGEAYARANFMDSVRNEDSQSGDVTLVLTGGDLLAGEEVHVIARADGTCTMAAIGFSGDRCKQATGPLESILGSITNEELTADYYHDRAGNHLTATD